MLACSVHLIGCPRLLIPSTGEVVHLLDRVALLCALVAFAPVQRAERKKLAQNLWSGSDEKRLAQSMRQLVSRLRRWQQAGQFKLFEFDDRFISFGPAVRIDVLELIENAQSGSAGNPGPLVDRLPAELLQDLVLPNTGLEPWLLEKRRLVGNRVSSPLLPKGETVGDLSSGTAGPHSRTSLDQPDNGIVATHRSDKGEALPRKLSGPESPAAYSDEVRVEEPRQGQQDVELTAQIGVPRIALLAPLTEPHHAGIAAALIEDVTLSLCRMRSLAVIAPHTALQWSQSSSDEDIIAEDIQYVLETRFAPSLEGQLELFATLVARPRRQVVWRDTLAIAPQAWSEGYCSLVAHLTDLLGTAVERNELRQIDLTCQPMAYHSYLLGRERLRRLDLVRVQEARQRFGDAAASAPAFSPAHSGTARTFILEWVIRGHGDSDLLHAAANAARRAVLLDPADANARRELGRVATFMGDVETSGEQMSLAERYGPGNADILADFADTLVHNSDLAGASLRIKRALSLNPLPPDTYLWTAGEVHFFLGEYQAALSALRRMHNPVPALKLMAASAAMGGDSGAAEIYRRRFLDNLPTFTIADWASSVPIHDRIQLRHYTEALRAAGFN